MSKEDNSEVKPVKLKLSKKGEKIFYSFIDNDTSEADKFQLLLNHVNREIDTLTNPQRSELIDILMPSES